MSISANKAIKMQPETEIAILQVQVKNIEDKIGDLKEDLKSMHDTLDSNAEETRKMLKTMRELDLKEHSELAGKISTLEKWRWMMMGAGIILGSIGFDTIAKLLK